jgi:nucleotide-binding universal stress UspA family protein
VLKKLLAKEGPMKILFATDGSKFSETAAQTMASVFRPEGAEVLVLQVVEPLVFSTPPQMAPGYAPEMEARLHDQLKQAKQSASHAAETLRRGGFKADWRVTEKETRTGILGTADEWRADLIVLGSHGEKGLRKFLLGSVAESVARHAGCSVLIVRSPSDR